MIGTASIFRTARAVTVKAARSRLPILILGESGSDKEKLMRAVHAASPCSRKPLQIIDTGAIPTGSIESVLFGCENGALPRQVGAVLQCDGGTLGIDDIHLLPMAVQERLVELLTRHVIRPIGAPYGYKVDVRLVAASSLSLSDLAAGGQLLPELLQAFGEDTVQSPPWRNQLGDMGPLCRHFLARIGDQRGLPALGITDGALQLLSAYHWPGNVREFQEVLSRAVVLCDGDVLTTDHFPDLSHFRDSSRRASSSTPMTEHPGGMLYTPDGNLRTLEAIEADIVCLAVGFYRGRMTEVARHLGISRSTLYRKLSELGLDGTGKAEN